MRGRRTFTPADNIGKPCGCFVCVEAGVATEPVRRVPNDPNGDGLVPPGLPKTVWIHGFELKAWLEARDRARTSFDELRKT